MRNGGANDKPGPPEDDHNDAPGDPTAKGEQGWSLEEILNNVDVEYLESDVAVKTSGDDAGDKVEGIADGLPAVFAYTLESHSKCELSLEGVDVETILSQVSMISCAFFMIGHSQKT